MPADINLLNSRIAYAVEAKRYDDALKLLAEQADEIRRAGEQNAARIKMVRKLKTETE